VGAAEWREEGAELAHGVVCYGGGFEKEVDGIAVTIGDVD
jgi:hypothetical protein